MPPLRRILVVFWALPLAGGAWAQDVPHSGKPAPPIRLDWEAEQQSFAQQYLTVPSGETAHGTRPESSKAVQRFADTDRLDFPNRATLAAEPHTNFLRTPGDADLPAEEDSLADTPEREIAGPPSDDLFARPVSQVRAPSSGEDRPRAPELLPPPLIPPKPIAAQPKLPERDKPVQRGESERVLPAMHAREDVPDSAGFEVAAERPEGSDPGDASSESVPPLLQPREAMPLKPPAATGTKGSRRPVGGLPSMVTVAGGLAVVLGIFFAVAWGMRRAVPGALTTLPKQVVEVLGRAPLASRQQVHLLRVGNKLLLVSATTDGVETLTEISDPVEVDRLAGLCEQANPNSSSAAFRRVLQQFAHEGKGTYAA